MSADIINNKSSKTNNKSKEDESNKGLRTMQKIFLVFQIISLLLTIINNNIVKGYSASTTEVKILDNKYKIVAENLDNITNEYKSYKKDTQKLMEIGEQLRDKNNIRNRSSLLTQLLNNSEFNNSLIYRKVIIDDALIANINKATGEDSVLSREILKQIMAKQAQHGKWANPNETK